MSMKTGRWPQELTEIAQNSLYNGIYHKREGGKCTMKFM